IYTLSTGVYLTKKISKKPNIVN
ncbi:hypothetical protein FWK35_00015516, partial [Aphis craccivora]